MLDRCGGDVVEGEARERVDQLCDGAGIDKGSRADEFSEYCAILK